MGSPGPCHLTGVEITPSLRGSGKGAPGRKTSPLGAVRDSGLRRSHQVPGGAEFNSVPRAQRLPDQCSPPLTFLLVCNALTPENKDLPPSAQPTVG